jgi:hypothetical protein
VVQISRDVLLDNFTLQATYGFLHGTKYPLYEECVSNLIESIVIYDRIYVPKDVLNLNFACKEIADMFPGLIIGESNHRTPDIHHHLIKDEVISQFLPLLGNKNPFEEYEKQHAEKIEQIGHPYVSSIGITVPSRNRLPFKIRHTYYTWYCLNLAASLGVNYVPNPTRIKLFESPNFMEQIPFTDFRRDVLKFFQKVNRLSNERISEVFRSIDQVELPFPLIYNYVRSEDSSELVRKTIELRESASARSYREFCRELETAFQQGNKQFLDQKANEIKELANQWAISLAQKRPKKKVTLSTPFIGVASTDIEIPWFDPFSSKRKPHFVFIHSLLSKI